MQAARGEGGSEGSWPPEYGESLLRRPSDDGGGGVGGVSGFALFVWGPTFCSLSAMVYTCGLQTFSEGLIAGVQSALGVMFLVDLKTL